MTSLRRGLWLPLLLPLALAARPAPAASPQKAGREYFTDEANGYRFKPLKDFNGVPLPPGDTSGLAARFGGPTMIIKVSSGGRANLDTDLWVYALTSPEVEEVEEGHTAGKAARPDIVDVLGKRLRWLRDVADKPIEDEVVSIEKLDVRHRVYDADAGGFQMTADIWTFPLEHADISLIYLFGSEKAKKWLSATEKSAKSFDLIERVVRTGGDGAEPQTYEEKFAAAEEKAKQTAGWRAVKTPSEKFIIVTSSDSDKLVDKVIERLEKSREIYEQDFPPPDDFDAVSIVRLCGTEEEFHTYGGTGGGVAGWFNPGTTELVLYDASNVNFNSSLAVMSHEAFHQYCHFLFGQSEAHRWFDEGHGDYYGGADTKGRKAKITKHMPAGLDRYGVIKQMVREGTYKPIERHINFSHSQWQNQGPSNVSCYAQSWSIIYFLRRGALGDVNRKYWRKEYADIIPNYVEVLSNGFAEAYAEILAEREKRAKAKGEELTEEDREINRMDLREDRKQEIWKKAMDASWGQVDIEQFEQDWLAYVSDEL